MVHRVQARSQSNHTQAVETMRDYWCATLALDGDRPDCNAISERNIVYELYGFVAYIPYIIFKIGYAIYQENNYRNFNNQN